jgi:NADH:ubiquinone oxidoreductase subunit 5 (subunit L)/multisubunit Na+/H+ antiporter MnhA subunit
MFATSLIFVGLIIRTDLLPFSKYYTSVPDSFNTTFLSQGIILPTSLILLSKLSTYYVQYEYYSIILLCLSSIGLIVSNIKVLLSNNIYKAMNFHTLGIVNFIVFLQSIYLYNSAKYLLWYYFFFKACLLILTENIRCIMSKETDVKKMGGLNKYTPITFILFLLTSISSAIVLLDKNICAPIYEVFAGSQKMFIVYIYVLFCVMHCICLAKLIYSIFFGNNRSNDSVFSRIKEVPFVQLIPIIIGVVGISLYICLFKTAECSCLDSNLKILKLINCIVCCVAFFISCVLQKLFLKHNVKMTNAFLKKIFNMQINESVIHCFKNTYYLLKNHIVSKKVPIMFRYIWHFYRKLEIRLSEKIVSYQLFLILSIVIFGIIFILLFTTFKQQQVAYVVSEL